MLPSLKAEMAFIPSAANAFLQGFYLFFILFFPRLSGQPRGPEGGDGSSWQRQSLEQLSSHSFSAAGWDLFCFLDL